jgi:hypothetical protein
MLAMSWTMLLMCLMLVVVASAALDKLLPNNEVVKLLVCAPTSSMVCWINSV